MAIWQSRPEKNGLPPGKSYDEFYVNKWNRIYWMRINECDPVPQIKIIGEDNFAFYKGRKADLVLSDMAPNLSGIASADAARVEYLMELALDFAQAHLKPSGALLVKCFNGSSYNDILKNFRETFVTVTPKKPKASRDYSSEIFLLGRQLRHPTD